MFNDTVSTPRQFISDRDEADRLDLKNVIGRLGERERKIIVMRYFEDMTQQQTGQRPGNFAGSGFQNREEGAGKDEIESHY